MQSMEHRAYKCRFYPTEDQAHELARTFGCVRYMYNNWALAIPSGACFEHHAPIDYAETGQFLVRMKKDSEQAWLTKAFCAPLQQAERHLNAALVNFSPGRALYPRFHQKHDLQSAITASGIPMERRRPQAGQPSTACAYHGAVQR
jgi:putative transposase